MTTRHTTLAILAAILALAAPLQPARAHAAAAPMLLRYRFVAGQTLTYRIALTETEQQTLGGKLTVSRLTITALTQYRFLSVAKDGKAHMAVHFVQQTRLETVNGKPLPKAQPIPDVDTQQWPDGKQVNSATASRGGYGAGDLGTLANVPVGVGSHWTSAFDNQPGLGQTLTCTNTLSALRPTSAGIIATIVARGTFVGTGQSSQNDGHFKGTTRERLQGSWQFNTTSGRFVSDSGSYTVVDTGTLTVGTKVLPSRTQLTYHFTMQPVGAQ